MTETKPAEPPSDLALAERPTKGPDRVARVTLVVALVASVVVAASAPFQIALVAAVKLQGALVALFAALAFFLALRALWLRRSAAVALRPALVAVLLAAVALVVAGFLAFHERGAALEPVVGAAPRAADLVAWELGRAQQRSRDLALAGGLALPGFALGALGLGLAIGARRREGAALEKAATDPKVGKNARRKTVAAGWSALLLGAAVFAAGLAIDVMAIAAPVEAVQHPRVADLAAVREHLSKAHLDEACGALEVVLVEQTPIDIVRAELPDVEEIAQRCVGHAIERLPKGLSCVERAATLASSATVKLVGAEDRAKAGCSRALLGD